MKISVNFSEVTQKFAPEFGEIQEITIYPNEYMGEYEVVPQRQEQVLVTSGKALRENITVKAIPKEYGLITYDQNRTITIT